MDDLYIKRVLNGDVEAFSYLVKSYQGFAFRTAVAVVKEEAIAKDLVQDSFMQAFHGLEKYRADAAFSTWLYRIVINNCLKFLAKEKTKAQYLKQMPKSSDRVASTVTQLEQVELRQKLRKTILQLPAKTALVLQLFYLEEYSIKEIESITPFSAGNIKVLLYRGRKELKTLLEDYTHLFKN